MKIVRFLLIPLVVVLLCVVGMFLNPPQRSGSPWNGGASGQTRTPGLVKVSADAPAAKKDPVVATVNGQAVHESDLALQLKKGTFGITEADAREARLQRMIDALMVDQFLRSEEVKVPEGEIDKQVQNLRENPPTAGCACCRYQSLEQFMEANYMDMRELRRLLRNDLGFNRWLLARWDKEFGDVEKRKQALKDERPRLENDYIRVSHIFFNTFQNPQFADNPEGVRKSVEAKAQAAWKKLQGGKAFDAVAKELSEDAVSRPKGGELGCISTDMFGSDFAAAAKGLKAGEYSRPVESPWGYHIIRREVLTDDDLSELLKSEFVDTKHAETVNAIRANAKVERPGQ